MSVSSIEAPSHGEKPGPRLDLGDARQPPRQAEETCRSRAVTWHFSGAHGDMARRWSTTLDGEKTEGEK